MRHVKRRWLLALPGLVIFGCIVFFGYPATQAPGQADAQTAPALDAASYSRVQSLRRGLCLSNADLAAMGLSPSSAAGVLETLVGWYRQNESAIASLERQTLVANRGLLELRRRESLGTQNGDGSALAAAYLEQLKQLAAERKRLEESARTAVSAQLPAEAVGVWNTARANAGWAERLRYVPDLTREEGSRVQELLLKQMHGLATEQEIAQVITGARAAASEAAWGKVGMTAAAIADAEKTVLPRPPALQESAGRTATEPGL